MYLNSTIMNLAIAPRFIMVKNHCGFRTLSIRGAFSFKLTVPYLSRSAGQHHQVAPQLRQQIILQVGLAVDDGGIAVLDLLRYPGHQEFYTRAFLRIRQGQQTHGYAAWFL